MMNNEREPNDQFTAASEAGALYQNMLVEPLLATVLYYAACLVSSFKALAHLTQNCLLADDSLRVGFSDRTLGTQLPSHHKKPGRDVRRLMQTVGILKDTGHETFRGMVTVPLLDASGKVTGIYGRRIDRQALGEAQATIGSGIFNGTALKGFDEIIVTDNVLDAWTFYSAGYKHVICPVNYTLQIVDLMNVKRVLLASASIDCEAFTNREIFNLKFPAGQSVHQYALNQRESGSLDPLGTVIRAAGWQRSPALQPEIEQSDAVEAVSASPTVNAKVEVGNSQAGSLCYASPARSSSMTCKSP